MKHFYILILCCIFSTLNSTAQVTFNGQGDGTSWFDPDNWDSDMIPTATDNVVIPSGFSVNQGGPIISVNSIILQSNAVLNTANQISLTGTSSFEVGSVVNINAISFTGGGIIQAQGIININASTSISASTTLNNLGTMLINGGSFQVAGNSVLNNFPTGVIDIQSDGGNLTSASATSYFNNYGLIKKTISSGSANIQTSLYNNTGTIQVENGTLVIASSFDALLINGIYNVSSQATLDLGLTFVLAGTQEGNIEGTLNLGTSVLTSTFNTPVNTQAIFDFSGNGTINFINPTFNGGGTFINRSVVNLISNQPKRIIENTTFNNENIMNISSPGDLIINDGTLNNQINAVIDMQADSGNIYWNAGNTHILNNEGLIKKTTSTGEAQIHVLLNNNDGIINVENGTLSFQNAIGKNLTDGVYNVFAGATLDWDNNVTLSGSMTGTLDGTINWNSQVSVLTLADIEFLGTGSFNWISGQLTGGGRLYNLSVLNLTGSSSKQILGTTIFENINTVNITSAGDLQITDGFFNNLSVGLLDLQADNGNITGTLITTPILNNVGVLRRSTSSGNVTISAATANFGFIEVLTGELEFAGSQGFHNINTGSVKGIATIDVPALANFTNDGSFSPGVFFPANSPGILTVQGDFNSSASSMLEVDLNGLNQGSEYDVLLIQGDAIFEGDVSVTLGFTPSLNDEFVIATTTGIITSCNLPSSVSTTYNGTTYDFDVLCRNNNEVVLTVSNTSLSIDEYNIQETEILLYPNPTTDVIYFSNNTVTIEEIKIFNISGQLVSKQKLITNYIDLSYFEKGFYLIEFLTQKGRVLKKIIKQ